MPAYLQVVLQESLPNLGRSGELVRVRPGYARNYLVPRGLAVYATEKNVARLEHEKREALARAAKLKGEFAALAARLNGVTVRLARNVGGEDRMYGSVTTKDVAEALAQMGHQVDRRKIELPDGIKTLGTYDASVRFSHEVNASFRVEVVRAEGA
jgi:large subunit ribosomal protein L9